MSFLEHESIRKAWREDVTGVRRSGRLETILRIRVFLSKSSAKERKQDLIPTFPESGVCRAFGGVVTNRESYPNPTPYSRP